MSEQIKSHVHEDNRCCFCGVEDDHECIMCPDYEAQNPSGAQSKSPLPAQVEGLATKRPWSIYDYEGRFSKYPKNCIASATGESIASIEGGWPQCARAENEANAALIVTAVNEYDSTKARVEKLTYRLQEAQRVMLAIGSELSKGSRRGTSDIELLERLHQEARIIAALVESPKED